MSAQLIYLIAGEPSGDLLAARLMAALRQLGFAGQFAGIGGEAMRAEGLASLFPQADLAVMGFAEVVPRIPRIWRRLRQTLADIERRRPDLIITIDSWGFTGRVTKALKRRGSTIPRLHYVAPMVWAWKEKRARQLADRVDRLLCLLRHEPAFFQRHGLEAIHVGHPVLERRGQGGDGIGFRQRHGIDPQAKLLCLLPGSRHSETSRLLPAFLDCAAILQRRFPGLRLAIPSVETVAAEVAAAIEGQVPPILLIPPSEKWDCFAASDAALAASGTVALELAVARLPMVIAYKVAPITARIVRAVLTVKYASLLNLQLDRMVVPEFLQEDCQPEKLADAVAVLIVPGIEREQQLSGAAEALALLGVEGETPSHRAAREALSMIQERPQ